MIFSGECDEEQEVGEMATTSENDDQAEWMDIDAEASDVANLILIEDGDLANTAGSSGSDRPLTSMAGEQSDASGEDVNLWGRCL